MSFHAQSTLNSLHFPANRTKVTRVTFRLFDYIRTVHSEFTRQSPPAISTGKIHFTSLPALNNSLSLNSFTDTSILFNNRARNLLSQIARKSHKLPSARLSCSTIQRVMFSLQPTYTSLHHPTRRRPITKLYSPSFARQPIRVFLSSPMATHIFRN